MDKCYISSAKHTFVALHKASIKLFMLFVTLQTSGATNIRIFKEKFLDSAAFCSAMYNTYTVTHGNKGVYGIPSIPHSPHSPSPLSPREWEGSRVSGSLIPYPAACAQEPYNDPVITAIWTMPSLSGTVQAEATYICHLNSAKVGWDYSSKGHQFPPLFNSFRQSSSPCFCHPYKVDVCLWKLLLFSSCELTKASVQCLGLVRAWEQKSKIPITPSWRAHLWGDFVSLLTGVRRSIH